MKAALLALLVAVLFPGEETPQLRTRADGAAQDIVAVVNERLPDAAPEERLAWAKVLFVWSRYEATWLADPKGSNDHGSACGILQIHNPHKYLDGATCEKIRKDRRLGLKAALEVMLSMTAKCGTRGGGLSAFSGDGMCPTVVFPLVSMRCRKAGLTSTCESK